MAVLKCKMCGGALEINNKESVATCGYCGTKQTLPRLDDEKRVQLYDRANYFRRENEFDKAMGIYEMILSEDKLDCESYWGIVLCRYGIEYVEDPRTNRRIPTVNRAQFTSIFDDEDYKKSIENADALQKTIYEEEAGVIDKIQKGILAISQKEEPFDVFICYKETDSSGNRTQDSVYAQDIYTALTKEGYKVFFSRITLEDKLGSAYEPYIFAALNSAKIMLVVGTNKENFNAVWVKNEWSRYLTLIKAGKEKTLIPVYKDISPYEMPEEFQYLQSQDMAKIGFMQDLVRGVSKLVDANKTTIKETVFVNSANTQTEPLLKRVFMFLEDGDFTSAYEYCEKVLDIDPECGEAYLGKLMVDLNVQTRAKLSDCEEPFDDNANYQKAIRFGDEVIKKELNKCIEFINSRNENARLEGIYNLAKERMLSAQTEIEYKEAANEFESVIEYKDSSMLVQECLEKAEISRKDNILAEAKSKMSGSNSLSYEYAIKLLKSISGWQDADDTLVLCEKKLKEVLLEEKRAVERYKKNRRISRVIAIVFLVFAVGLTAGYFALNPKLTFDYNNKIILKNDGTVIATGLYGADGEDDVTGWTDIIEISEWGSHTVGLKSDGTVVAVGSNSSGQCDVEGWTDIVAISAGGDHTVGLKSDGTVIAVGSNSSGQCDVEGWTDIVSISAGTYHTVGLKSDGTVIATGYNEYGQCDVGDWTDIKAIGTNNFGTVCLKSDGTVIGTDDRDFRWTDIVAISSKYNHVVGLKIDGTVVASGYEGTVGEWTDIVAVFAGGERSTVGLKSDGTIVYRDENISYKCKDYKDEDIASIIID